MKSYLAFTLLIMSLPNLWGQDSFSIKALSRDSHSKWVEQYFQKFDSLTNLEDSIFYHMKNSSSILYSYQNERYVSVLSFETTLRIVEATHILVDRLFSRKYSLGRLSVLSSKDGPIRKRLPTISWDLYSDEDHFTEEDLELEIEMQTFKAGDYEVDVKRLHNTVHFKKVLFFVKNRQTKIKHYVFLFLEEK